MSGAFFDNNMAILKSRYPEVAEYLRSYSPESPVIPEEEDITAGAQDVCGKTVMCALKDKETYQLDSLYDPEPLLNLWYASLGINGMPEAKVFMYGFGSGMYARYFLERSGRDQRITVHEPSAKLFLTALNDQDLSGVLSDERFRLVFWPVHCNDIDIKLFYEEIIDYTDVDRLKVAIYANYPRLFEDDCRDFLAGFEGAKELVRANQLVHDRFGGYFARNSINNLGFIPDSYSFEDLVNEMPEDIPAIIVAGGPSLDKNIHELKNAKGKCLMISTDTALRPLALAGIEPDITMIMDGKKDERYLSEESSRQVPLVCSPRSGYAFLNLHEGMKFFTDSFCDHIKSFMDEEGVCFETVSTGGSVANICFGLAEKLHCKRIILVGQDLAYTGDKTHSGVTVRGEWNVAVKDFENPVMGTDINGDPIITSLEFQVYRQWFEDEIRLNPDLFVIDATEGGIRIGGTTIMTLKSAIEKECTDPFDFKEVLSRVGKLLPGDKRERFLDFAAKIPGQMNELKDLIGRSQDIYSRLIKEAKKNNPNSFVIRNLFDQSTRISRDIENSPVIEYVHNQLQGRSSEMLDRVNERERDGKNELLTVCDIGQKYLKDMLDAISEIEPYVEKMRSDPRLKCDKS